MTGLIIASILLPFLGSLLVLVIPRAWIRLLSQVTALLSALCSLLVLIGFTQAGKVPSSADLMYLGNTLVFGVVTDKLSVLIGMALGFVGFLIVVYSTGYLTDQNREHPEKEVIPSLNFIFWVFAVLLCQITS